MMGEPISCIPTTVTLEVGRCDVCHWVMQGNVNDRWSAHPYLVKHKEKRVNLLNSIDAHRDLRSVLPDVHDLSVLHVCRICGYLILQKGRQHGSLHRHHRP